MIAMLPTLTLEDYHKMKAQHPDLILGAETDNPITLARVCARCGGDGRELYTGLAQGDTWAACSNCGGKSMVLTADGETLRDFMRKFGVKS